jgi:hypothetical protein
MKITLKIALFVMAAIVVSSCGVKNDVKPPVKATATSFSSLNS